MARVAVDEAEHLTAAEVVHSRHSPLPGSSSVADVRAWFAASEHREIALLADDGMYAGSLLRDDLAGDVDPQRRAGDLARSAPTVSPQAPALRARELALAAPARRLPVVDDVGRLVGVVAITPDLRGFCGAARGTDDTHAPRPEE